MSGGMTFEERRAAVELACVALTGIESELFAAGGADLGEFMGSLGDELGAPGRCRYGWAGLAEAVGRGETGARPVGCVGRGRRDRSPGLRAGGSARVVRLAEASHATTGMPR